MDSPLRCETPPELDCGRALAGLARELPTGEPAALALSTGDYVFHAPAMRVVLEHVQRVASSARTTVLVTGESGVGKEVVARAVHESSARARGPFVALNCAALQDGLLEAELFGYAPGAFTGALPRGRSGLFAAASGGSIFLDEIGELAPALQAKLLRVLQERCYRPIGGGADQPMDARVIASTNRDLEQRVAAGAFREDLYYRLNVLQLRVPALRERPEDVPVLAERFLREFSAGKLGFTPAALRALAAHAWPGNVRELRNRVERACVLARASRIEPAELELPTAALARPGAAASGGERTLAAMERAWIEQVLRESGGNRSRAARELGIDRSTLYEKLRRYALAS